MAYEEALKNISVPASTDLSERQYRFVVINGDGELAVPSAGAKADGILQNAPDAQGEVGAMGISGVSKLEVGGAVTAGDDIAVGTDGKGVVATTGDIVKARALADGSGDGSIIPVMLVDGYEPLA